MRAAIEKGIGILKQDGVCVIDVHADPSEDHLDASSAGGRKTE
jgi:hypothetical protein